MENTDSQASNNEATGFQGGERRENRGYGGGYGGGPRRFGGSRPFRPVPVRVGEEYDVKIESMSKRGDSGVARVQGLVIFVTGTKVGDSVKIKISKVGRGYATADVVGAGTATATTEAAPTATEAAPAEATEAAGSEEEVQDSGQEEEAEEETTE